MCDEYDDERMRLFWRAIAEGKELEVLPEKEAGLPVVELPPVPAPEPLRRRPQRLLTR